MGNRVECREFLDWALPRMGFRPAGFWRVRGQVCKRIGRRLRTLALRDLGEYRRVLEYDTNEWTVLDSLCRITISRFCRDRAVFDWLLHVGLPELAEAAMAQGRDVLSCWSAGCGSGEEPFTLRLLWDLSLADRFPALRFDILATDTDATVLERARRARYPGGSMKELPEPWIRKAFTADEGDFRLRESFRYGVRFLRQDIRRKTPDGPFDLVLCRNLVFTYFERPLQRELLARIRTTLVDGGILVVGRKETLPENGDGFGMVAASPGIYRLPLKV